MIFADNYDYDAWLYKCLHLGKITIQVDDQPYNLMAMHTVSPLGLLQRSHLF